VPRRLVHLVLIGRLSLSAVELDAGLETRSRFTANLNHTLLAHATEYTHDKSKKVHLTGVTLWCCWNVTREERADRRGKPERISLIHLGTLYLGGFRFSIVSA
jgi:hypothetical protein